MAHWFVSCIDRVNHSITKRYRRSDEVFCSAYIKIAFLFIYQEQACSAVNDAGQRARQEEERREVESVKCLIGTRDGGSHLTYPNVCAHHKCRLRKLFLIKRKFVPRDFFLPRQVKCVHRGFHGPVRINLDLNKKRHDIVRSDVLFLSKTTRCNDRLHIYTTSSLRF